MVFFTLGAVRFDYGQLNGPLPEHLVTARFIFLLVASVLYILTGQHIVIVRKLAP